MSSDGYIRGIMTVQTRTCKACGRPHSAHTETCPHCGKDDKYGSQFGGAMLTFGLLMILLPIVALALVLWLF